MILGAWEDLRCCLKSAVSVQVVLAAWPALYKSGKTLGISQCLKMSYDVSYDALLLGIFCSLFCTLYM